MNSPVNFNDPTGHVCSDPDDPTPSCDGSGMPPRNTPAPLPDDDVYIPPDPLDDGLSMSNDNEDDNGETSFQVADNDEGILDTLRAMEELFNWSLTTPGEMTIYQEPSYPFLGGIRLFYRPIFTFDNRQALTISPVSISSGPLTLGFNGNFRYKEGLNSISALGIDAPTLQPWGFKVSVDISYTGGQSIVTNRIGVEYIARPDNWTYVGAVSLIAATYGYVVRYAPATSWDRVAIPEQ